MFKTWWKTSNNGITFTEQKPPAELSYKRNDLDADSYRSVVTGKLIRNRIRGNVAKFEFKFNGLTASECSTILSAIEPASFYAQIRTPEAGLRTIECYAGTPDINAIEGTERFNLSFSLIEY